MEPLKFTAVIPRIKVLETRLLDKAKLDRIIDSNSPQEAIKILGETEYANVMTNVNRAEDYEEMLSSELKRVFNMLYDMCPEKSAVDVMTIKYDYHNLKVLIKGKLLNKDLDNLLIPVGKVDVSKLKYAIDNQYYRDFNPIMRKAIEYALEAFDSNKDPQEIDIILDNYMFEEMKAIAKNLNDKFLNKYITTLVDLTNIKTLLRVKKIHKGREFLQRVLIKGGSIDNDKILALLTDSPENISNKLAYTQYSEILKLGVESYAKTGSVTLMEKLCDNYIMNLMRDAKFATSGIEPILAYMYAKETEIKLIRIIMVGKLNNIAAEVIRERLRDSYV